MSNVVAGTNARKVFGRAWLAEWLLDPEGTYLNHGTVGATPKCVLAVQNELRDAMERQPARFMLRELSGLYDGGANGEEPRMRRAAREVAPFFAARADDLVFTDNATAAVNAVLRSFPLAEGDELLLPDHAYGAVRKTAEYVARAARARVTTAVFPFPLRSETQVIDAVTQALTPRTRMLILDHVTSSSALVLPVAEIAALCRARGVALLVDGAHATGAFPLDIPALGADWYTGNLHKWGWAPRSSAILWAAPERQRGLSPTTISWGLDQGFCAEFDWVGTRDPTPWLAAPAALSFMRELGFENIWRHNHALAWQAGQLLAERWGTEITTPESMIGTMVTVPLPARAGTTQAEAMRLRDALLFEEQIEVQVHAMNERVWARVSAQIYNELADVERLADAVAKRLPP